MTANTPDNLSLEGSIKIDQDNMPTQLSSVVEDGYLDYEVAKDLQGDIDYLVIDGTLPLEPTRNAETWMNMLQIMQKTGLNMEYNAGKIAEEAIRAMGIKDRDRFRISPQELQATGPSPSQQLALMEKMRGASVKPQDDIQNEGQKGSLVPMRQGAQR